MIRLFSQEIFQEFFTKSLFVVAKNEFEILKFEYFSTIEILLTFPLISYTDFHTRIHTIQIAQFIRFLATQQNVKTTECTYENYQVILVPLGISFELQASNDSTSQLSVSNYMEGTK